jgi:hypothetical protein
MTWKWVALVGIVVAGFVSITFLDKYDERSCRQQPIEARLGAVDEGIEKCDGFLPW